MIHSLSNKKVFNQTAFLITFVHWLVMDVLATAHLILLEDMDDREFEIILLESNNKKRG